MKITRIRLFRTGLPEYLRKSSDPMPLSARPIGPDAPVATRSAP